MQHFFSFYPSRQLALCILVGHAVAMGALLFISIPKVAFILLFTVLSWSATYYLLRDARLKLACAWIALRLEGDRVILFNRNGDELTGKLLSSSVVTPYIVILNIALPHHRRRQNVVLMPDSMDAEAFRQLRVILKWSATHTP